MVLCLKVTEKMVDVTSTKRELRTTQPAVVTYEQPEKSCRTSFPKKIPGSKAHPRHQHRKIISSI